MTEQQLKQRLSKQFGTHAVQDIEAEIKKTSKKVDSAARALTERLYYLEFSLRFKENPKHKRSSFQTYLETEFGIRHQQYKMWRLIFTRFSEQAEEVGIGTAQSIIRKCGIKNADDGFTYVIDHIRQNPQTRQHEIPKLIDSAPVVQAAQQAKQSKAKMKATAKTTTPPVKPDIVRERDELLEQNAKLKATVEVLKTENAALKAELDTLRKSAIKARQELAPWAAVVPAPTPGALRPTA